MRSLSIPSPVFRRIPLVKGLTSHQAVEKRLLYLMVLSLALHLTVFVLWWFWPKHQQQAIEPVFIDLQDMPELKRFEQAVSPETIRPSDQRRRVLRETAPKDVPTVPSRPSIQRTQPAVSPRQTANTRDSGRSAAELLRRKPQTSATTENKARLQPNLLPNASRMAALEENYRRRFADDVDEGTTRFLNTDDIQFGSFLRRFETAVYGVWRYPQEAALKGIEGTTPVKITFNKKGDIVRVQLLESSGSRILDDEVFRTLRLIGPMGALPKSYGKDEFNLIAFFQYGNARGRLR